MIPTASRSLLMRSKKAMIVNTKDAEERVRKEHAERIKADAVSFDKSKGFVSRLAASKGPHLVNSPFRLSSKTMGQSARMIKAHQAVARSQRFVRSFSRGDQPRVHAQVADGEGSSTGDSVNGGDDDSVDGSGSSHTGDNPASIAPPASATSPAQAKQRPPQPPGKPLSANAVVSRRAPPPRSAASKPDRMVANKPRSAAASNGRHAVQAQQQPALPLVPRDAAKIGFRTGHSQLKRLQSQRRKELMKQGLASRRGAINGSKDVAYMLRRVREQVRAAFGTHKITVPLLGLTDIPGPLMNALQLQLMSLDELSVADNKLTQLPVAALKAWNFVKTLNMRNNLIKKLPQQMDILRFVRVLDFSQNKLRNVPLELMQLQTLEELYLDNNEIRFFPQPLRLPALRTLQVTHNFLEFLPDGLQECTSLTKLDLSHNVLASAAILPSRKVAAEDDTDDPMLRPWEWEAQVDPDSGDMVWFHKARRVVSRVDPRLAALTLRKQHNRVMAHLAITRNDGIVVGVENAFADDSDEDAQLKIDPLWNVPMVNTVVKQPTPRAPPSVPLTSPVMSAPPPSPTDSSIGFSTRRSDLSDGGVNSVVDDSVGSPDTARSAQLQVETHAEGATTASAGQDATPSVALSQQQQAALKLDFSRLRSKPAGSVSPASLPSTLPTKHTNATGAATTVAVAAPSDSPRTRGGTPSGTIAPSAAAGTTPGTKARGKPPIRFTEGGRVVWDPNEPIEVPPGYTTPRVATVRFEGQVLRALLREGRGEWQVLQEPDTGELIFRNNITLEKLSRPPDGVDLFGGMVALRHLNLSHNKLVQLPKSVETLKDLEVLSLDGNHMPSDALPAALGNCKKLRRVTCRYNKMRQFPMAITKVLSLRELQLCGNEMEGVPPEIGNLVNLRSLWITENAIKELPKELAKCEKIKELRIGLNPMIPKWRALVAAGAAQMLWTCRQMTLADERGPPPEMKYDLMGVGQECMVAEAEAKVWHAAAVDRGRESGTLMLSWKDLKEIPPETFGLAELRELKIVGNDIKFIPERLRELTALEVLHYHKNRTKHVAADAFRQLTRLRSVSLEDNKLKTVPRSLPSVSSLVDLTLSHNRIEKLPSNFGFLLPNLQRLYVTHNHLAELPPSVGLLTGLRHLWISNNELVRLPDSLDNLTRLVSLRASRNKLTALPRALANMRLVELNFADNLIEEVPEFFTTSRLRTTLRTLLLHSNHIAEVSPHIRKMTRLQEVRLDVNPLKSPPPECTESVEALFDYCKLRHRRIRAFVKAAGYQQFVIDRRRLMPTACDCVVGGAGYMNEDDLAAFDAMADMHCNGRVYEVEETAEEAVKEFVLLRHERATAIRAIMIHKLVRTLDACRVNNWVDSGNFSSFVSRPWGPRQRPVRCYAITADAFFGDNQGKGNVLQRALRRKGVYYSGLPEGYPDPSFVNILDTLRNFQGPYGFVGTAIDTVDFKDPQLRKAAKAAGKATARNKAAIALNKKRRDLRLAGGDDASELGDERKGIEGLLGGGSGSDDEDDDASEQIYREYDLKSALVVQRVLWTDEDRRNYEKEQAALDRIETKVMNEAKHLLRSKEGKRKVKIEIRRQRMKILAQRRKVEAAVAEATQVLRDVNSNAAEVVARRHRFMRGAEEEFADEDAMHEECSAIIEDLFVARDDYEDAVKEAKGSEQEKKEQRLYNFRARRRRAISDYVKRRHKELVDKFMDKQRLAAHIAKHLRPWDGVDGEHFKAWQAQLQEIEHDDGTVERITPYMVAQEQAPDDDDLPPTAVEVQLAKMKKGFMNVLGNMREAAGF